MQVNALRPTGGIYQPTPDYIHGIEVIDPTRFVFIAGTMGLHIKGEPGESIEEQLVLIWGNIARILREANMAVDNIVRVTTYLADSIHADANGVARSQALGGRVIPTTAIVVETLSPGWLVEVEAIAVA